jgi:hypothetical protein
MAAMYIYISHETTDLSNGAPFYNVWLNEHKTK